jgi:DnaJ like chaperone protein
VTDRASTEFEQLILQSNNQLGTSILLILSWIATCDGTVDKAEAKQLSEISAESQHGLSVQSLIRLAKSHDTSAIQLACEIVASHFKGEKAHLFMEMAIRMSIADERLLPAENYILRFLADLLGLTKVEFKEVFKNFTGREIPPPSDVRSATRWREREKAREHSSQQSYDSGDSNDREEQPCHSAKAIAAYATLGLEPGASPSEIKKSYQRLAQVHHPDRFSSLGEESVVAASQTFVRIREAYDYLVKYA